MATLDSNDTTLHVKEWWAPFLEAFANTGNVSRACETAKIARSTAYIDRREIPAFSAMWDEAEEQAISGLEDVAQDRARTTSDTLLIFLLKCRKPNVYRDIVRNEQTGPNGGPIEYRDLTDLSDADLDREIAAIERGEAPPLAGTEEEGEEPE